MSDAARYDGMSVGGTRPVIETRACSISWPRILATRDRSSPSPTRRRRAWGCPSELDKGLCKDGDAMKGHKAPDKTKDDVVG